MSLDADIIWKFAQAVIFRLLVQGSPHVRSHLCRCWYVLAAPEEYQGPMSIMLPDVDLECESSPFTRQTCKFHELTLPVSLLSDVLGPTE